MITLTRHVSENNGLDKQSKVKLSRKRLHTLPRHFSASYALQQEGKVVIKAKHIWHGDFI